MNNELAHARTLVLWATVVAGVALFVLVVDLRTKQDLLEVYRREQATPRSAREPHPAGSVMVDHAALAHPSPVPDDSIAEPGNVD